MYQPKHMKKDVDYALDKREDQSMELALERELEGKPQVQSAEQIGRSAALMSVLVIVSRITGFLRTWAQVFAMGVTVTASCYTVANNLPNQLYELVMGGMLITAFLPVYLSVKKKKGIKGANEYTSNLISIVLVLMGAVCLLGIVFASQIVWTQSFSANKSFDHDLAVYFFQFFAIEVVLYSLSTVLSGVLNAERDYLWSNAAPIFNNFVVTASFFAYAWLVKSNPSLALLILALGNPLGVLIQVVVQIPSMRHHGIKLRFHINLHDSALKETLSIGIPSLLITAVGFVTLSFQTSSALMASVSGSSIAYYTRLWYTLPYSILAIPITTAMFTELSEMISENNMKAYTSAVTKGIAQILFFLVPCAMFLIVFADPLISILAVGKLDAEEMVLTISYLQTLALALPFFGVSAYLQKVTSSLRRMKMFALSNALAGAAQIIFLVVLTPRFGLSTVAASQVLCVVIVDGVTLLVLRRYLPGLHLRRIVVAFVRALGLGLIGCVVGGAILMALPHLIGPHGLSVSKSFAYALIAGIPALIATFGLAVVFHVPESTVIDMMIKKVTKRA